MKLWSLVLCGSLFCLSNVQAEYGRCTAWEKSGHSCIVNFGTRLVWVRECTHAWDAMDICLEGDPNQMEVACTRWERTPHTTCIRGRRLEQKWVRACKDRLQRSTFCSDQDPNEI